MVSYIYCNTGKPQVLTTAGDDVLSSHLQGQNWKVDAALAYRLGRFLPYVGAGFSQQFINTKVKVSILTTDENGYEYTNQTEFDSRFKSSVFYGFAGVEYKLNTGASVYLRGSFPNPLSATLGFRIVL
jgi:opacity protein-like surface antigen